MSCMPWGWSLHSSNCVFPSCIVAVNSDVVLGLGLVESKIAVGYIRVFEISYGVTIYTGPSCLWSANIVTLHCGQIAHIRVWSEQWSTFDHAHVKFCIKFEIVESQSIEIESRSQLDRCLHSSSISFIQKSFFFSRRRMQLASAIYDRLNASYRIAAS